MYAFCIKNRGLSISLPIRASLQADALEFTQSLLTFLVASLRLVFHPFKFLQNVPASVIIDGKKPCHKGVDSEVKKFILNGQD